MYFSKFSYLNVLQQYIVIFAIVSQYIYSLCKYISVIYNSANVLQQYLVIF